MSQGQRIGQVRSEPTPISREHKEANLGIARPGAPGGYTGFVQRSLQVVFVGALAVVLGITLLLWSGAEEGPVEEPSAEELFHGRTTQESTSSVVPGVSDSAGPAGGRRSELGMQPGDIDLAQAVWVEGRVIVPEGTPADERISVFAVGRKGTPHEAPVLTSGHFRVAFAPTTRRVRLRLEARYLRMDRDMTFRLSELPDEIVLAPELGARVAGRFVTPDGGSVAGEQCVLLVNDAMSLGARRYAVQELTDDHRFNFGPLPAYGSYSVELATQHYVHVRASVPTPKAGTTEHLELPLEPGVRIAGRVVDERESPIEAVHVRVLRSGARGGFGASPHLASCSTDKDGAFEAVVSPGSLEVVAEKAPFETLTLELGDVRENRQALVLRMMSGGQALNGVVLDPDGKPVADVELQVYDPLGKAVLKGDRVARTNDAGRFKIVGVEEGPFTLAAAGRIAARPPIKDRDPTGDRELHWGFASSVRPGVEITVTLAPGCVLEGLVRNDLGVGLGPCDLVATASSYPGVELFHEEEHSLSVAEPDGSFRWAGLPPGRYWLFARGPGASLSNVERVELPGDGVPVQLSVPRRASIHGVVTSAGQPVSRARVRTLHPGRSTPPWSYRPLNPSTRTDAEGAFRIDRVGPGPVQIWASAPGQSDSVRRKLDLSPGGSAEVLLELRAPGRLVIDLHPSLSPTTGQSVDVRFRSGGRLGIFKTDANGRIELESIEPGDYVVKLRRAQAEDERVSVVAGATTRYTLGQPPSIALTGTVRCAGEALAGVSVSARHAESKEIMARYETRTDEDGRYHLLVQRAGEHLFEVGQREGLATFTRQVPASAGVFDFELASGRVSGSVSVQLNETTSRGDGQDAAPPRLRPRLSRRSEKTPDFARARHGVCGRDGSFAFEHIPAGRYVLRFEDSSHRYGRIAINVVVEEGQDVDVGSIALRAPCAITGGVYDANGRPLAGVAIRLITEDRNWLGRSRAPRTRSDGTFRVEGIAEGRYRVHASLEGDKVESEPVEARRGSVVHVELHY